MSALTADQITALIAQSRNRGGAERLCKKLLASDELNIVITDEIEWKGKDANSVRNTFNQCRHKVEGGQALKVLVDKENNMAILVNLNVLSGAAEDEDTDTPSDEK